MGSKVACKWESALEVLLANPCVVGSFSVKIPLHGQRNLVCAQVVFRVSKPSLTSCGIKCTEYSGCAGLGSQAVSGN